MFSYTSPSFSNILHYKCIAKIFVAIEYRQAEFSNQLGCPSGIEINSKKKYLGTAGTFSLALYLTISYSRSTE